MKVMFLCSDKEREIRLADAFLEGVTLHGDDDVGTKVLKSEHPDFGDADAVCMVGVKSLELFRRARDEGRHVIYLDKGYLRHRGPNRTWEYWRIAINDHHPTDYVARAQHTSKRWDKLAWRRHIELKDWREAGTQVIYAGSSDKYHKFVGLPDPTTYAQDLIDQIKRRTNRLVVYRPKPTWLEAVPVKGASFSGRDTNIGMEFRGAWCMVTHGSNAAFDAIIAGIPCIVLGNGIGRPVSSTSLDDIEKPYLATNDERQQWLNNLAWCMFSEDEMRHGLAWATIRPYLVDGGFVDECRLRYVAGRSMKVNKKKIKRLKREGAVQG